MKRGKLVYSIEEMGFCLTHVTKMQLLCIAPCRFIMMFCESFSEDKALKTLTLLTRLEGFVKVDGYTPFDMDQFFLKISLHFGGTMYNRSGGSHILLSGSEPQEIGGHDNLVAQVSSRFHCRH